MDGDLNRESANGTWISLSDHRDRRATDNTRQESDPKEVEDGTEIKISDSILKIEIKNNEKKKKGFQVQQFPNHSKMEIEK